MTRLRNSKLENKYNDPRECRQREASTSHGKGLIIFMTLPHGPIPIDAY